MSLKNLHHLGELSAKTVLHFVQYCQIDFIAAVKHFLFTVKIHYDDEHAVF